MHDVVDSVHEGTDPGVRRFAMRMRLRSAGRACVAFLLGRLETDTKLQPLSIEEGVESLGMSHGGASTSI